MTCPAACLFLVGRAPVFQSQVQAMGMVDMYSHLCGPFCSCHLLVSSLIHSSLDNISEDVARDSMVMDSWVS